MIEVVCEDEVASSRAMKTGGGGQLLAVCACRTEHRFKLSDAILFHCLMGQVDGGQGCAGPDNNVLRAYGTHEQVPSRVEGEEI